jgi:beta-lactamase superfamily II metal-dependent hydrolase
MLIDAGDVTAVIDGNAVRPGEIVRDYLWELGVKRLDYIVNSHAHADHHGGLPTVINGMDEIGTVILSPLPNSTVGYRNFLEIVAARAENVVAASRGDRFYLGEAVVEVLSAKSIDEQDRAVSINESSVVMTVTFGSHRFLFTGDAGNTGGRNNTETELVENYGGTGKLISDVLKVGHHGSAHSSTAHFISAVNPTFSVICVGVGNSYGHPTQTAINNLLNNTAPQTIILRTDLYGHIIFITDGVTLEYTTQKTMTHISVFMPYNILKRLHSATKISRDNSGYRHGYNYAQRAG